MVRLHYRKNGSSHWAVSYTHLLQEYMGYCLIPSNKAQKLLIILGKGGEGKSRIGLVMRKILGTNMNVSNIQKVEHNRFARADLEYRLLMVDDDMKLEALKDTNYIKTIVTLEAVSYTHLEILDLIARMHKEKGITVILVSHSMEDVAKYVERIIVMNHGQVMFDNTPCEVFKHYKELEQIGLAAPQVTYLMHELKEKGLNVNTEATTRCV